MPATPKHDRKESCRDCNRLLSACSCLDQLPICDTCKEPVPTCMCLIALVDTVNNDVHGPEMRATLDAMRYFSRANEVSEGMSLVARAHLDAASDWRWPKTVIDGDTVVTVVPSDIGGHVSFGEGNLSFAGGPLRIAILLGANPKTKTIRATEKVVRAWREALQWAMEQDSRDPLIERLRVRRKEGEGPQQLASWLIGEVKTLRGNPSPAAARVLADYTNRFPSLSRAEPELAVEVLKEALRIRKR